jgi:transposase
MSAKSLWVGLDVGADETAVCATNFRGAATIERMLPTDALVLDELLRPQKRRIRVIALESCSSAIPLTRSLRKLGYRVAVFDTRQVSKFLAIRRNKTDKNDARGLAEVARLGRGSISEVRVKSRECQRLRSTLVTRQKLVSLRMTLESSMRSLFLLNGGRLRTSSSAAALRKNVAAAIKNLRKQSRVDLAEEVLPLLALSEAMRNYVETIDAKLLKLANDHSVCRDFLEITGVGPICALSFYSSIEDPQRFKRNSDVGPYLGMVPSVRQSGLSTSKRRISKMGDAMTRSYLVNAALSHMRYGSSALSAWGAALAERATKRQAHVAVARKLAVLMLSMWKSGERYQPYHQRREGLGQMKPVPSD